MSDATLDTIYQVETPEGIDLQAPLAGPLPRILAYGIDLCWRGLMLSVLFIALIWAGEAGRGLFLLVSFLLEWFYPVFFEIYARGQTPGKKSMGLIVVNDDDRRVVAVPAVDLSVDAVVADVGLASGEPRRVGRVPLDRLEFSAIGW